MPRALIALLVVFALGCGMAPLDVSDHTYRQIARVQDFETLSTASFGTSSTKFVITSFSDAQARELRFLDSHFYSLHDEWYWFRLLNGGSVPGDDVSPVFGHSFASIDALVRWAHAQPSLPLDLSFNDDRLYSPRFYREAFGPERRYGVGSILRIPARESLPERWAFELEFSDAPTYAQLVVFFETLARGLPSELSRALLFLVRSPGQESLAMSMEQQHLTYFDRLLRYRDLVVPGAREVYSDGITAGRLRVLRAGDALSTSTPDDIVVLEGIPDFLPPAAGLITTVPQTPLAHVNLLARNRGIPNVHIAGVLDDGNIGQLARGYAPVLLLAESPDRVVLQPITEAELRRYGSLLSHPLRTITTGPVASLPYLVDLSASPATDTAARINVLGGKCAGMIALLHEPGVFTPDSPQCLSIRAYAEHLAPLRERIAETMNTFAFQNDWHARQQALQTIRQLVESMPIAPATLAAITSQLRTTYGALAPTQGIRFRSSSNAEDLEGFNGAGLYESFTGFLDPSAQSHASDQSKTVERAIQRVWGSFWSFEAFEERRLERVDHLAASMAVLIAPRFDDPLERSTGVCTFTIAPDGSETLVVNVQAGEQSVANPDPAVLPEIDRVERLGADAPRVARVRRSSLSAERLLLDDAALGRLFRDTSAVAHHWLDRENTPRSPAQRARGLTLDFEFHDMSAGWPALRSGEARPARLVLKQVRSLEPGPRVFTPEASQWAVPREVFVRLRRVTEEVCEADVGGSHVTLSTLRALTDPSVAPDVGFAQTPLDASITVSAHGALSALGWAADARFTLDHTELTRTTEGSARRYRVQTTAATRVSLDALTIDPSGEVRLEHSGATAGGRLQCHDELRFAGPRDYLLSLLPTP